MTFTREKLTSDLHALSRNYSPSDSSPDLAAQAQGRLQRQRAKRAGGTLVAALAIGALAFGSNYFLSDTKADTNVVVDAAGQGNTARQSAPETAAVPVVIEDKKEYVLTSDITPQENVDVPVVTVNQQNPAETMNVLSDRLAKTDGTALKEGYHLVQTTVSPKDAQAQNASVWQKWYSTKGDLFLVEFLTGNQSTMSPERVHLQDKAIRWYFDAPTQKYYSNDRYVKANGDGAKLIREFRQDPKPEQSDVTQIMLKQFGRDSSMPLTGLQQAGMLRALAMAGPLSMTEVTKDHFGRDVVNVWSAKDENRTGLLLSAHTGEIFANTFSSGETYHVSYHFAEYIKAAK